MGLLEELTKTSSLIEPFRNPCTPIEIRSCLLKLYTIHGEVLRQAKRKKTKESTVKLPFLWILSPTCSTRILEDFEGKLGENEQKGVYFFPKGLYAAVIVIHQLPINQDTRDRKSVV